MYSVEIGLSQAKRICRLDSQGESGFVRANTSQVLQLVNTWMRLGLDLGIDISYIHTILDSLNSYGLIANLEACEEVATFFLEGFASDERYTTGEVPLYAYFANGRYLKSAFAAAVDSMRLSVGSDPVLWVTRVLQFTEYPMRFTYIGRTGADQAYEKFFKVNGLCRLHRDDWSTLPGEAIQDALREELEFLYSIPRRYSRSCQYDIHDAGFTSGSAASVLDSGTLKYEDEKWSELSKFYPCLYGKYLQYPLPGGQRRRPPRSIPTLMAVPKRYNSRRIIAPENVVVNYLSTAALYQLRRILDANHNSAFINETDQTVNRDLSCEGSLTGDWCTIDMSSASDSISRYIFMRCVPEQWREYYLNFMSCEVQVNTGAKLLRRPLHMLLTSGNPLTWLTEAVWFLALGRVGCRLAQIPSYRKRVFAYGDDLIVPAAAYETVMDVLETFGHTVNRRKSYGTGGFRESCGGWYFRGHDVTPLCWPRRTISDAQLVSCMVDLQHKFYAFDNVRTYLEDTILRLEPQMTRSPFGEPCQDLWDEGISPYLLSMVRHWSPDLIQRQHVKISSLHQHVAYYRFLQRGPLYLSEEDKAFGISASYLEQLTTHVVVKE